MKHLKRKFEHVYSKDEDVKYWLSRGFEVVEPEKEEEPKKTGRKRGGVNEK